MKMLETKNTVSEIRDSSYGLISNLDIGKERTEIEEKSMKIHWNTQQMKKFVCVWEPEQISQVLCRNTSQHTQETTFSERKKEREWAEEMFKKIMA